MFQNLEQRVLMSTTGLLGVEETSAVQTVITVNASGDEGTELGELRVDDNAVGSFSVDTQTQAFTFVVDGAVTPGQISVAFLNDTFDPANGIDGNLTVDNIVVDGTVFETEDPEVFSTGSFLNEDGIVPGFRLSETLNINGFFQFSDDATGTPLPAPTAGIVRIQAEDLSLSGGLSESAVPLADGGLVAALDPGAAEGQATAALDVGPDGITPGTNNLSVFLFNEGDSQGTITVQLQRADGTLVEVGAATVDPTAASGSLSFAFNDVALEAGDQLLLTAEGEAGGTLAIDFVEFVAVTEAAEAGFEPEINFINIGSIGGLGTPFINNPTSLTFGADGRLYITQQSGQVQALTIDIVDGQLVETAPRETLTLANGLGVVQGIINHDDDGSIFDGEQVNANGGDAFNSRQVTGIVASQDADGNPLFYISSSDPRISAGGSSGVGPDGNGREDTNLDTNSGIITRVTATPDGNGGFTYDAVDIVRGLPRSEENHSVNGLILNEETNTLLVNVGGNTNNGSPSAFFSFATEFVLSGTILEIDLNAIEALPIQIDEDGGQPIPGTSTPTARQFIYDLPTLDDPNQINAPANLTDAEAAAAGFFENSQGLDLQGPFGGNDGFNQAILPEGAPIRIFADGLRNNFDLVQTANGQIFTVDNGSNGNLGAEPVIIDGVATNLPAEQQDPPQFGAGDPEPLFQITEGGFFGHGAPVRGDQDGAFAILNNEGLPFAEGDVFDLDQGLFIQSSVDDISTLVPEGLVGTGVGQIDPGFLVDPTQFAALDGLTGQALEDRLIQSGITVERAIGGTPNPASNSIVNLGSSTNGIAEFTGDAFGGALQGALVVTQFNDNVTLLNINEDGTALDPIVNAGEDLIFGTADDVVQSQTGILSIGAGVNNPLDVIVGAAGTPVAATFENVVLVAAFGADNIFALAPTDVAIPDDNDADNDGVLNIDDPFTRDATNGGSVVVEAGETLVFDFDDNSDNNQPGPDGLITGLTGVAINGTADFEASLSQPSVFIDSGNPRPNQDFTLDNVKENTAAGGGANVIELVSNGTATGTDNDGEFLLQTGVTVSPNVGTFTANFTFFNPGNSFDPNDTTGDGGGNATAGSLTPLASQEIGGFIGDGTQFNFLRVVATDNAELGEGFLIALENNDVTSGSQEVFLAAPELFAGQPVNQNPVNIALTVDLSTPGEEFAVATASFQAADGSVVTVDNADAPISLVGTNLLNAILGNNTIQTEDGVAISSGLAVGLFSTNGNAPEEEAFTAIFDEISITATPREVTGDFTAGDVVFAVNAGGPALTQTIDGEAIAFGSSNTQDTFTQNGVTGTFNNSFTFSDSATIGNGLQTDFVDTIFATERFGNFQFQAEGLSQGVYFVDLFFAEIFASDPGFRVFDVSIEGQTVLDDLDILAQNNGDINQTFTQRSGPIAVSTDGILDLDFLASSDLGKVSAIVIREADPVDQPADPVDPPIDPDPEPVDPPVDPDPQPVDPPVDPDPEPVDPPVDPPADPPALAEPVRIQAEDFTLTGGFFLESVAAADGGLVARVPFGGTGIASIDLPDTVEAGINDLTLAVFDENDGVSALTVQIQRADGPLITLDTLILDQDGGFGAAEAANLRLITLNNVEVQQGDTLLLNADSDAGEAVRIDFVEFVRTGDAPTDIDPTVPAVADPVRLQAEDFTLAGGFFLESVAAADGGLVARVPFGGTGTASIDIPETIETGLNDLTLAVFDEDDGVSTLTVQIRRTDGSLVTLDTLTLDQDGGFGAAEAANLRFITLSNIDIQPGDELLLLADSDAGEAVRIDFVEFNQVF